MGKINNILKTKYDPVTVKLSNPNTGGKINKTKLKKKKKKNTKTVISGRNTNSTKNDTVSIIIIKNNINLLLIIKMLIASYSNATI